jgi:hypothetical protein
MTMLMMTMILMMGETDSKILFVEGFLMKGLITDIAILSMSFILSLPLPLF